VIFHITTHEAWSAATDMYRTGDEEFIHFSFASQLAATAGRHYAGVRDMIVLSVDESGLDVRVEDGFPHLYEPVPVCAVLDVTPLEEALESGG